MLGIILLLALVLRFGVIYAQGPALTLESDDVGYINCAANWLATGTMTYQGEAPTAFIGPVFPAFVALIFAGCGSNETGVQAVRYVQAVLGVLIVLLAYLLAIRLTEERIAFLVAFLMAVYPPNIMVNGLILTETLYTVFLLGYIFLLLKLSHEEQLSYRAELFLFGLLGAFTAILTLTRAPNALYPVIFLAYLWWRGKIPIPRLWRNTAALVLVFCVVMSPWWVRNYIQFDRFIPFSSGAGEPLLLGTYVNMEGLTKEGAADWPVGNDELDAQQKYKERALERLEENVPQEPWRYFKWYTWGKFMLLWSRAFVWEPIWWSIVPWITKFHAWVFWATLGGIGLTLWRWWTRSDEIRAIGGRRADEVPGDAFGAGGQFRAPILLLSLPFYYTVVHNVYFGFARYNVPFMPLMFLFAAYGLVELSDYLLGVEKGGRPRMIYK